jgi:DNA-binding response OmpR family regulator
MQTNLEQNSHIKILIIEDDHDIRDLIRLQLKLKNYNVTVASNASETIAKIENETFQLFLIDRMLPDTNGVEICKLLRINPKFKQTPIILVTALSQPENIIEGLDAGANDYITKPFDINILHARVRAQLRGIGQKKNTDILNFGPLKIDIQKCKVNILNEAISLTNTEFQILTTLAKTPGVVHTRESLIFKILGDDVHVTNRTIDTHIAGLRKKLQDSSNLIETIRGVGYRFQENE